MKIIVVSDSHGNLRALNKALCDYHADLYIHLGDGERELDTICRQNPDKQIYHVCGNCDYASLSEEELLLSPDDKNVIFAVHGHRYNVRYTLEQLKEAAGKKGANIVLYGHTHSRHNEYDNGMYILNPGSVSAPRDGNKPSFAVIELLPKGIITNIVDL
ncbi:MAG: YfcE family phosphodiesterase [Oscillospiraceae bacterium]|nr:YfcE family phosphodiesterase [Oscillospiraceae bacterium]